MLVSGFQDPEKAQKWPVLFCSLIRGYEAFCPLVPSEYLAVYGVLVTIEFIFVAFCLDTHNEDAARSNASMLCWLSRNREALVIRVRDSYSSRRLCSGRERASVLRKTEGDGDQKVRKR